MLEYQNKSQPELSTEQILKLKLAVESKSTSKEDISQLLKSYGFEGEDPLDLLFDLLDKLDKQIMLNKKSIYNSNN